MAGSTLFTVCIIPPASIFPVLRIYSDRLALISPVMTIPAMPHLTLTGVHLDPEDPQVKEWINDLTETMKKCESFKLEFGRQMRMSGGRLPDNFSLSVPPDPTLLELTDLIIDITHKHFPSLDKRGLRSLTDHVCLVEHIPDQYRSTVAREAQKSWIPISFR